MNRSDSPLARPPVGAVAAMALSAIGAMFVALSTAQAGATPRTPSGRHGEAPPVVVLEQRAHEAFLARRYAEAYGRYAELADEGNAPAAWMALMLVSNGPTSFGSEWSATPGQLRRWNALAAHHAEQRTALVSVNERGD